MGNMLAELIGAMLVALGLVVAIVMFVVGVMMLLGYDPDRLKKECMADGHKEYECVAMLRNNYQPVPIVTPVYVGR